jgi:predicted RNA binding protein YcfA (HicA-like mRNA interferase family)
MGDLIRAMMKVRDAVRLLEGEGWFLVATSTRFGQGV